MDARYPIYTDGERTIDLNECYVDDGNAYVDGPHDAPYIVAAIMRNGERWGEAYWTTLKTDVNTEPDLSGACDWANPDFLFDGNCRKYTR